MENENFQLTQQAVRKNLSKVHHAVMSGNDESRTHIELPKTEELKDQIEFLKHVSRELAIIKGYNPNQINELINDLKSMTLDKIIERISNEFGDLVEVIY